MGSWLQRRGGYKILGEQLVKVFSYLVFFILFFFFSFAAQAENYNEETSIKIIKEAEDSYKKVLKVKNAWRDTKKIIKNAKKAHREENYEKSITLGKKALNEAKMAYEQYEKQKDNYRFLD